MSKFTSRPARLTEEEFLAAAETPRAIESSGVPGGHEAAAPVVGAVAAPADARRAVESPIEVGRKKPWEGLPRKAPAKKIFNLKFNEYQWAILLDLHARRDGVDGEKVSIQQVCQEIMVQALEREAGIGPARKEDRDD